MEISVLAQLTGVPPKTIRYYESIGVLPSPKRKQNGYREYGEPDIERVKFVSGARRLGFSLDDIAEIMALREQREAPCRVVLNLLNRKAREISERIVELQRLESELEKLYELGLEFPTDDVNGKECVCHLVSSRAIPAFKIRVNEHGKEREDGSTR